MSEPGMSHEMVVLRDALIEGRVDTAIRMIHVIAADAPRAIEAHAVAIQQLIKIKMRTMDRARVIIEVSPDIFRYLRWREHMDVPPRRRDGESIEIRDDVELDVAWDLTAINPLPRLQR